MNRHQSIATELAFLDDGDNRIDKNNNNGQDDKERRADNAEKQRRDNNT